MLVTGGVADPAVLVGSGMNIQIQTHSHTDISASVTALVSLLTDRLVRPDLSMTGEITLRGLVLPVGGVRDKVSSIEA